MKKNRILTSLLAGALSMSLAVPALGVEWTQGSEGTSTPTPTDTITKEELDYAGAHTIVSVISAPSLVQNVSFTVPLYATLALISGQSKVEVPTDYAIVNTGDTNFSVSRLTLERLQSGGRYTLYTVVGEGIPGGDSQINLKIGRAQVPASSNAGEKVEIPILTGDTDFATGGVAKVLKPSERLSITFEATVKAIDRSRFYAAGTASQFRLHYVVTPEGVAGNGFTYSGDSKKDAGLGAFTPGTDSSIVPQIPTA